MRIDERAAARLVGVLVGLCALSAHAQIPDKFTNLKVLPKRIEKRELVSIMRGWAGGLGVRCVHCHVGPDNLQGMDFASDAKATKRAAREMARMVRSIEKTLGRLPPGDGPRQGVTCLTCHRGAARPPRPMEDELFDAFKAGGAEGAVGRYRELRRTHGDDGQYDVGRRPFTVVATRLAESGQADDALALLRAALELMPDSAALHSLLGRVLLGKGDREGAEAAYRKALTLDPEDGGAKWGLQRLQEPPK